jgi:hypothetical protein
MPAQRIVTLEDAKPGQTVKVELYQQDEAGVWETTGEDVTVPSLIYLEEGCWGMVNDFTPANGTTALYLCAPGDKKEPAQGQKE